MTLTDIATIVTAAAAVVAIFVGRKKLNEIHILVNSRMTEVVKNNADLKHEIVDLKKRLGVQEKINGTGHP
jgi:hypothetical protein